MLNTAATKWDNLLPSLISSLLLLAQVAGYFSCQLLCHEYHIKHIHTHTRTHTNAVYLCWSSKSPNSCSAVFSELVVLVVVGGSNY